MKIAMLSPTTMSCSDEARAQLETRQALLNSLAPAGMEITLLDNPDGPRAIETMADEYYSIPGLLKIATENEARFDGYITGCFGEPGLDAVRELVKIPAVGCCGPAIHMASLMSRRFAILSPVKSTVPDAEDLVKAYGLGEKLATVQPLEIPVLEIRKNRERVIETAGSLAKKIAAEYEVDAFVLGCMSLAYQNVSRELSEIAGVPVINPLHTAIAAIGYWVERVTGQKS